MYGNKHNPDGSFDLKGETLAEPLCVLLVVRSLSL